MVLSRFKRGKMASSVLLLIDNSMLTQYILVTCPSLIATRIKMSISTGMVRVDQLAHSRGFGQL